MFFRTNIFGYKLVRLKSTKINTKIRRKSDLDKILLEMSRDRGHITEAQKQRIKIKEKSSRYVPGTASLQVLGCGGSGSPASVYLFTDQSRYLFNCGEGTQRLAHEHKTKLSRLEHIFMTRTSWKRLGGLPGLSLTVQDAGVPYLTLHGPSGLDEIFRGMKKFVVLKDLKVETVNCDNGQEYDDSILNVLSIPLRKKLIKPTSSENLLTNSQIPKIDDTNYFAYNKNGSQENEKPAESTSNAFNYYCKHEENVVMSYICRLKPKPGHLNLEKCVEKGVPPGPLLGQLKNGIDVTLSDGTIVKANDVREATDHSPLFIFVDIPSIEYLESLEDSNSLFEKYQDSSEDENLKASIVIHFTPDHIFKTKVYKRFVEKFSKKTRHLILNSTNKFSGYLAAHRIQWQLNQIDPQIFPILKENIQSNGLTYNQFKKIKLSEEECNDKSQSTVENFYNNDVIIDEASSLTTYHLRPAKGLDHNNEPTINHLEYIRETQIVEGFPESLNDLQSILAKRNIANSEEANLPNYPKLVFLGTGSCIPNKTRNVSSILLHTSPTSCVLMDCGEGTWGQIVRFYGETEAKEVLKNLKSIYISHLHADHHIGLIGILQIRQKLFNNKLPPLLLLAPAQIEPWLHFYNHRIESINQEYYLMPNGNLINVPLTSDHVTDMQINSIQTCLVQHCPHSFGVAFEISNSYEPIKITYSGDTMPSNDLINLGLNSTILIHEATMEDELVDEAKFKMHSTVSQAIEQGHKMNAKYTILTHFSQRYAKLPRIENVIDSNVGIAFDNMQISLKDLKYLHKMYPTLKLMFTEHCDELEQKALKRTLRKERKMKFELSESVNS